MSKTATVQVDFFYVSTKNDAGECGLKQLIENFEEAVAEATELGEDIEVQTLSAKLEYAGSDDGAIGAQITFDLDEIEEEESGEEEEEEEEVSLEDRARDYLNNKLECVADREGFEFSIEHVDVD